MPIRDFAYVVQSHKTPREALAAEAMGLSSVSVVSNALRLRRFRPPWRGAPVVA